MAKLTPPLKFFLEVIHKNKDRILIRIHGRTQKALNWLKIWPTDLERFLDCHFIFICLSVECRLIVRGYGISYTYIPRSSTNALMSVNKAISAPPATALPLIRATDNCDNS